MKQLPAAAVVALILAACQPTPAPPAQTRQADAPAPTERTSERDAVPHDCQRAADLASRLMKQRAQGMTEDAALAELSAAGDYAFGYVVDQVFRAEPDASEAVTRADILATCRTVSKTGATY